MFCERSVDKREKRNERTGNVLSDICTSTIFLFPSLIDVSEGLLAFFFCSRFLIRTVNCTLSLQSDPPPRPTKLYVPMSRCISAATCLSQQSGLTLVDSCGSQSMRSRRTLVELNSLLPPVQSPLNPPEYLVLLAVPVESQNTVANAAALWHLISPGDLLLSEF